MVVQMESLVSNLLMLARMDGADVAAYRVSVSVKDEIRQCLNRMKQTSMERNISVVDDTDENLYLTTHPDIFHTVVSNLISNAILHGPAGATVRICTKDYPFQLKVSNPAPNLTEDDLPLLFNRLWQHDQSRSNTGHHGLGLSLGKSCADALSMRLTASLDAEGNLHMTLQ